MKHFDRVFTYLLSLWRRPALSIEDHLRSSIIDTGISDQRSSKTPSPIVVGAAPGPALGPAVGAVTPLGAGPGESTTDQSAALIDV